jgi:hypothetical protein
MSLFFKFSYYGERVKSEGVEKGKILDNLETP